MMACYIASSHSSCILYFSLFLFFSGLPGYERISDARERRRDGKVKNEREKEEGLAENAPDDGFGGTREIEGERNDRWLPW